MSDEPATPDALERCIESLAFCHTQDEHLWAAARIVAQQDIDAFMQDAGADLAAQHHALSLLMTAFEQKFPHPADPVLIRSYMRRQMRRIGFDLRRGDEIHPETEDVAEIGAPATAPTEADVHVEAESEHRVSERQDNG